MLVQYHRQKGTKLRELEKKNNLEKFLGSCFTAVTGGKSEEDN